MRRARRATRLPRLIPSIALVAAACGAPQAEEAPPLGDDAIRVTDASGADIVLPGPAKRVISLVPSATETLDALGVRHVLVGRTDFDRSDWSVGVPSVGGGIEPNMEEVIALEPDLVIRFAGEQDPRTPERLDDFDVPHVAVRPDRIEDLYSSVLLLGQVTGVPAAADSLVAELQLGLEQVARDAADRPRVQVAYVLGGTPPWVAGPGTYIHELLELVGADNVFADLGSLYASVSPEQFRARDIEVVLVGDRSQFDASLAPRARVEETEGGLEIPGPGLVAAARELARLVYGKPAR